MRAHTWTQGLCLSKEIKQLDCLCVSTFTYQHFQPQNMPPALIWTKAYFRHTGDKEWDCTEVTVPHYLPAETASVSTHEDPQEQTEGLVRRGRWGRLSRRVFQTTQKENPKSQYLMWKCKAFKGKKNSVGFFKAHNPDPAYLERRDQDHFRDSIRKVHERSRLIPKCEWNTFIILELMKIAEEKSLTL